MAEPDQPRALSLRGRSKGLNRIADPLRSWRMRDSIWSGQVEDIVDTGNTTKHLIKGLMESGAETCALVALLNKKCRRVTDVGVSLEGFEVIRLLPNLNPSPARNQHSVMAWCI